MRFEGKFAMLYKVVVLLSTPKARRISMTKWEKFKHYSYLYFRYDFVESLRNIRRRVWNKRLKLWWYQLFIRKNEFHPSLNTDIEAMLVMNDEELEIYRNDLYRRRVIAHNRDIAEEERRVVE